jgi:hypothetical protein
MLSCATVLAGNMPSVKSRPLCSTGAPISRGQDAGRTEGILMEGSIG